MIEENERRLSSELTLGVGGVNTRFEAVSPDLNLRVTFPRTRFLTNVRAGADSVVRVRFGNPDPGSTPPWYVSGGTWEVHEGDLGGDRVVFYTADGDNGRAPLMRVDFNSDLSVGELVVDERFTPGRVLEIGFPLDEHIAARLLARRGSVIVHGASVVENDGVLVFIGHSGAGKSTIASIAEQSGLKVLSDDRTVLALRDDSVVAAGTPWHGSQKSGSPETLPARAVFLLEQADEDEAMPMEANRAFAEMMVRVVRPLANLTEQEMVVDTLERMVRSVPFAALRFRPTVSALDVARHFAEIRTSRGTRSSS